MRNVVTIAIIGVIAYLLYRKFKNKLTFGLGKITRPPKVRIVYSKKLKPNQRPQISSSQDAERVLREIWSSQMEIREEFVVLLLDRSNRVLGYHLLSKGGLTGTVADIRLIFSVALESLASGIILSHNHPSGNTKPSNPDLQLTNRIKEAGKNMDITVLDHLILTKDDYYSFADNGMM